MQYLLLFTIFVVATCGLIYELVAGTLASYLLGDSVTQFSTIIGVYLFSMGIGSLLSKYIRGNLLATFIRIEILTGLVGGFSSSILFLAFSAVDSFRIVLYSLVFITGALVGLEIPLVMRILQAKVEFKDLVAKVFTFDYIGALLASLLFPLVLVPFLGLLRTSMLFGAMNAALALYLCVYFKHELPKRLALMVQSVLVLIFLLAGMVFSNRIMSFSEEQIFGENIIFSTSSPYQRIVLTRKRDAVRLYLNNNLQFSSDDEYRYHEALVHPAMCSVPQPRSVLILGGGDGMAAREVLKYPSVQTIVLVDLDKVLTGLFKNNSFLTQLNKQSLADKRLSIVNTDAFEWLRTAKTTFDVVIIDFPDPSGYSVGKLYTTAFYRLLQRVLHKGSVATVQSTSPLVAPRTFWCVRNTLSAVGFAVVPYHAYVPSFGEWGFFLFGNGVAPSPSFAALPASLAFFNEREFSSMKHFSRDMLKATTAVQKLDNQVLVQYFEQEWAEW